MSNKKYLRKNEFRYNISPNVQRRDGRGHVAYLSAKKGHKAKINVITHSDRFFNEPTQPLSKNPEIQRDGNRAKDKRTSRFSVPVWENDKYLQEKPRGIWHMSKEDRIKIKKFNKKYSKKDE